ncbi:guanylate kinase, partial [Escherichia coli]
RTTSLTTRSPRKGERDGVDYHFVDENKFYALKEQGAFLEWAKVHGNFYATLAQEVDGLRQKDYDVLLEIDVQGAAQIRNSSVEGVS